MKALNAHDVDLRQLEIFCRIVELKSFTRAAEELFLTQPTVSGRMQMLEQRLGTRLLDRTGKEVAPTKAGEILYQHAKQMLAQREAAMQELSDFLGVLRGTLEVGASTIPGEYLLPPLIAQFKQQHSGITVRLRISDSARVVDRVESGQWEVGVVGSCPRDREVRCHKLEDDDLVLIVPPHHRFARRVEVDIQEILDEPFVTREAGSGTRRAFDAALLKAGFDPQEDLNVVCELGSNEAVKQCVAAGGGIAIVSARSVKCELVAERLKTLRVHGLPLERSFFLIRHRERTLSPLARTFVQFLLKR